MRDGTYYNFYYFSPKTTFPMATILPTDTLSLSALRNGRLCVNIVISGCSSMSDVIREMRKIAGNISGLISLRLRNITQGWMQNQSVLLRPAAAV